MAGRHSIKRFQRNDIFKPFQLRNAIVKNKGDKNVVLLSSIKALNKCRI